MLGDNILSQSAIAAAVGLAASVAYSLTEDPELIGAVLVSVGPLFLVSVVFVFILEAISAKRVVRLAAFVSPLFVMVVITTYAMWIDSQKVVSDGAGNYARFFLTASLVGLAASSVCLFGLLRRGSVPSGGYVERERKRHSDNDENSSE